MINNICDISNAENWKNSCVQCISEVSANRQCNQTSKIRPFKATNNFAIVLLTKENPISTAQRLNQAIKVAYVTGSDLTERKIICAAEFTVRQAQH